MLKRTLNCDSLNYIKSLYDGSDEFDDIHKSAPADLAGIQLSYAECKTIAFIFNAFNCRNILEIGTLVGYSAAILSTCVNSATIVTCEKNPEYYNIALNNFKKHNLSNIKTHNIDALTADFSAIVDGELDAVFLDANKAAYPKYLEKIYPLLKKGGVIVADNTLLWGEVATDNPNRKKNIDKMCDKLREYNKNALNKELFDSIIIPTLDGLTISVKK